MEAINEYDSLAQTIQISEITTKERNARIIRRIRNQDPTFTRLTLFYTNENEDNYKPMNGRELVWLGYFIGSSNQIQELSIADNIREEGVDVTSEQIKLFLNEVNKNKSIKRLLLNSFGHRNFQVHDIKALVKDNSSLVALTLRQCVLDHQVFRLLPLAQTLQTIAFDSIHMNVEALSESLQALGMLPQLQYIALTNTNIGVNGCREMAAFLGRHSTNLANFDLCCNSIDDEAIEVLVPAISSHTNLRGLGLSNNPEISARGHVALSALLKSPNCSLEVLDLEGVNMNDEGAQLFADALANNKRLMLLCFYNNDISANGWAAFSCLVCDSSSINKIFLSNHTLRSLSRHGSVYNMTRNKELATLLYINGLSNSRHQAATLKIICSHSDLNMEPLFEWDFKVMPYVLAWLEEAGDHASRLSATISRLSRQDNLTNELATLVQQCQQDLPKRKLSALYQFIRGMPELYIESNLLQQLNETQAVTVVLQHQLEQAQLRKQRILAALQSRHSSYY